MTKHLKAEACLNRRFRYRYEVEYFATESESKEIANLLDQAIDDNLQGYCIGPSCVLRNEDKK